ncbi:integrator complex subunit 4 [Lycorma delicatula]|uniref:integrator complex subunit 4 n=1 Tax=Lycorma delicatula TaxID=130591 RepID=UPI003F5187B8
MAAVLKKRALAEFSQTVQEQPPIKQFKKLRLIRRPVFESGAAAYIGLIDKCKSSNEALQLLMRISESLHLPMFFTEEDVAPTIRRLCEHFNNQKESTVRVKVLWLLGDIGCKSKGDIASIVDDILVLIKKEISHKVLAQAFNTLFRLGKLVPDSLSTHQKLVTIAKQHLSDTSHSVKRKCLELIGEFLPVGGSGGDSNVQITLKLVNDYIHSQDARVRSAAFKTLIVLHERGIKLDVSVYSKICESLSDDYEVVRQAALKLVFHLGQTYPETIINIQYSDEEIRLVDDAFGKVCNSVNDLSLHVRTQAAQLLGNMTLVGDRFLQQTLDKKLISNLRKKRSAHERAWENVQSGEWASGNKWADDAPREVIDVDQVNLMNSGACGAFVHGLEDEFLEVRSASVDAICSLSLNNQQFANLSLDFLVDMFNDEIEDVRLKAIDSLTRMSQHITLREDQLETILGALEDFSVDVREGLHRMLASCRLSTKGCLQMCVESLLDNLKKYPQDKKSTWHCLQEIGSLHPELTLPLVPELLAIHPFFDMPEPDVEDPLYVSILILVFNAAQHSPTTIQLFEEHTLKHYSYLRDTMPNLVPSLKVCRSLHTTELTPAKSSSEKFLKYILDRLEAAPTARVRTVLLEAAERDLSRLSEIDETVAGLANFVSLYIASQLQLGKLLSDSLCYSNNTTTLQANLVKNSIAHLLQLCLKLQYLFSGLSVKDLAAVKQLKLKTLALQLVYIVRASNLSALAPCDNFLMQVEDTQRYLMENGLIPEPFSAAVFREMSTLEEAKPGTVARMLLPLLQASTHAPPPRPTVSVKMNRAVINQPAASGEVALKFTAGLVMGIPFDADIYCLQNPNMLRLRVKYPDQQTQLIVPKRADLRLQPGFNNLPSGDGSVKELGCGDYRLLTTVLISHQVWTEACYVDISIVLDLSEHETGLVHTTQRVTTSIEPCIIELCKSVKVYVSPKPVKRGV